MNLYFTNSKTDTENYLQDSK